MPLDKSRIQGFGSDGPAPGSSSASGGGGASVVKVTSCPQGHTLQPWTARPGWCDQCGRKVVKGEQVMDCRQCNWYLCDSCCPQDAGSTGGSTGLWGALSSISDSMAVQSALDSVALRFGDVIDAATQEMSEMATEVKSFVASSMGIGDDDEDEEYEAPKPNRRPSNEVVNSVQRQEAAQIFAEFCEKYPATRVAPNAEELEKLWGRCSAMPAAAIAGAIYDQLSFSDGELAWQPRLRVLHALESFHQRGGIGKDVGQMVASSAGGLLQHLVQVQQCESKASAVVLLLMGKEAALEAGAKLPEEKKEEANGDTHKEGGAAAADAAPEKAKAAAKPKAKAAAAPAVDLLDLPEPAPPAAAAAASSGLDLLMSVPAPAPVAPAAPGDLLLIDLLPAAAAAPTPAAMPAEGPLAGLVLPASSSSAPASQVPGLGAPPLPGGGAAAAPPLPFSPSPLAPAPAVGGPAAAAALGGGPAAPLGGGVPGGFAGTPSLGGLGGFPGLAAAAGPPAAGGFPGLAAALPAGGFPGVATAPPPAFGPLGAGSGAAPWGQPPPAPGAHRWPPQGPASPGSWASTGRGSAYNIPAASDLTPLNMGSSPDPFAFVSEHTGISEGRAKQ